MPPRINLSRYTPFTIKTVPVGDAGQVKTRIEIACSCGNTDSINGGKAGGNEGWDMALRVFRRKGWKVERRQGQHGCPSCVVRAGNRGLVPPSLVSTVDRLLKNCVVPASSLAPLLEITSMPAAAAPPPELTRDKRRLIKDRLDEVYEDDKGYTGANSDASVAKALNVPRAWVAEIREDFFGPDINEEAAELVGKHQELTERAAKLESDGYALLQRADQLKKDVAALEQKLRR